MTNERSMELLNAVIDYFSVAERNDTVIETLLHIGFTSDELVEDFGYSLTDVREVEEDMEEMDVCPVCGAEIDPNDGEDNGYGGLHLYWNCEACGSSGKAIIDKQNGNAFIGHEVY